MISQEAEKEQPVSKAEASRGRETHGSRYFSHEDRKSMNLNTLEERDGAVGLQNIDVEGLSRKILRNKDLAARICLVFRVAVPAGISGQLLCTVPVSTFRILSQGCSSQCEPILLWKAVKNKEGCDALTLGHAKRCLRQKEPRVPCR